jgi:hypothetical protein
MYHIIHLPAMSEGCTTLFLYTIIGYGGLAAEDNKKGAHQKWLMIMQ